MNSTLIAVLGSIFVFGGALAGVAVRVPAHHQDAETKDVVKLVMVLVATISALSLSLLIASAHSSYDIQESEVQQLWRTTRSAGWSLRPLRPRDERRPRAAAPHGESRSRAAVARCSRRTSSQAYAAKLCPYGRPIRHRRAPDTQFRCSAFCTGACSATHDDHGYYHPPAAPTGRRLPVPALLRCARCSGSLCSSRASVSMRARTPPSSRRCSSAR